MSTIAIIGGHGKIGLLATKELADAGHTVRSIIRNPEHADEITALGATPVIVDIETATSAELAAGISSVDAIIFTAGAGGGSGPERKETVDHQGAVKSMEAATELRIQRFVLVSYIGADDPASGGDDPSMIAYQKAKKAADDALRASDLEWTIVRPGALNDDPATHLVTIDETATGTTSRGNTAALLALLATDRPAPWRVLNVIDGETSLEEALKI